MILSLVEQTVHWHREPAKSLQAFAVVTGHRQFEIVLRWAKLREFARAIVVAIAARHARRVPSKVVSDAVPGRSKYEYRALARLGVGCRGDSTKKSNAERCCANNFSHEHLQSRD